MNKKIISSLIVVILVVGAIVVAYNYLYYLRTTRQVVVNFENVDSVTLYMSDQEIQTITSSGDEIRIESMSDDYTLSYKASSGYADGRVDIDFQADEVDINPSYSDDRLSQIYDKEKSNIWRVIDAKYKDYKQLYKPRDDRLYMLGRWFGVILDYKGDSFFNRDSVALVLHKTDDRWQVVTDPPLPSVNTNGDPAIPLPVVEDLNKKLFD